MQDDLPGVSSHSKPESVSNLAPPPRTGVHRAETSSSITSARPQTNGHSAKAPQQNKRKLTSPQGLPFPSLPTLRRSPEANVARSSGVQISSHLSCCCRNCMQAKMQEVTPSVFLLCIGPCWTFFMGTCEQEASTFVYKIPMHYSSQF